jgi:prophage tail gpP-like protein
MPKVALRVNGKEYDGWKSARVTRGIETVSGSFELEVSDRWKDQDQPWSIFEEDECTVLIDGVPVITGYVDRRSLSLGPEEHTLRVEGRDKTGDLVDCSAMLQQWEFKNINVLTLAKKVAEPYGINVSVQAGVIPRPVKKLSIDPGDSSFEVIEKACRLAALLPVSDGAGGLLLTRAGLSRTSTALVQGENILQASAEFDATGKHRTYAVLGQHQGSEDFFGPSTTELKGFAEDLTVRRAARTLLIRPEGNVTAEQAKTRAQWEATVRRARGDTASITVQGWTQASGTLWPVNALVSVRAPFLGIDGDALIVQATYSIGEGGTTTTLSLKPPDSFKPESSYETGTGNNYWREIVRGV